MDDQLPHNPYDAPQHVTAQRPASARPAYQQGSVPQGAASRMAEPQQVPAQQSFNRARPRKHMGVASSDPSYLPPVDNPHAPSRDREVRVPVRKSTLGRGGSAQNRPAATTRASGYIPPSSPTLQVRSRGDGGGTTPRSYISQPKKGRSIFTSREEQRRRHVQIALAIMVLLAIALALVWFFLLRG